MKRFKLIVLFCLLLTTCVSYAQVKQDTVRTLPHYKFGMGVQWHYNDYHAINVVFTRDFGRIMLQPSIGWWFFPEPKMGRIYVNPVIGFGAHYKFN